MRKQIYELTLDDLAYCPVWEYVSDEEKVEGQDEATVRSRDDVQIYDPVHSDLGTVMLKTEFVSFSGAVHYGYCTPALEGGLSNIHPVIITLQGQVAFYLGALKPSMDELNIYYERLNTTKEHLFPIQFRILVPAPGYQTSGTIYAFVRRTIASPALVEFT